ncbi:MAG: hypothetical protein HFJ97_05555 [Eubacterium sp.]|nr:hypothetical protein [Eubacterium sp.]
MKRKSGLKTLNIILSIVLVVCIVATVVMVSKPVKVENTTTEENTGDVAVIDAFAAGTYGGKDFQSIEDVVNYYNECYAYTKTLTAEYDENGETKTYYKLVGDEKLNISNLLVEGKSNSMLDSLVPSIAGGLFSGNVIGLSPSGNRARDLDTRADGAMDCTVSHLTADDVLEANVVDNNDGTINITIQPKAALLSMPGEDSQGRFFNSLGDISSVVSSIDVLSFSSGTVDDNFVVDYKGGTGTVTINTSTNEITAGDFEMKVHINVSHANVAVLKDKSASLDISYTNHYPADDQYLMDSRKITRK